MILRRVRESGTCGVAGVGGWPAALSVAPQPVSVVVLTWHANGVVFGLPPCVVWWRLRSWVVISLVARTLTYFNENPRKTLKLYGVIEEAKGACPLSDSVSCIAFGFLSASRWLWRGRVGGTGLHFNEQYCCTDCMRRGMVSELGAVWTAMAVLAVKSRLCADPVVQEPSPLWAQTC